MDNASQLEALKKRIKYDEDVFESKEEYKEVLENLLEDSYYIALSILYPFEEDYTGIVFPSKYRNWQIRACQELYKLAGREGVSSYSENGLSWTMFRDGLSQDLLDELIPKVKAPKRIDRESEEDNV